MIHPITMARICVRAWVRHTRHPGTHKSVHCCRTKTKNWEKKRENKESRGGRLQAARPWPNSIVYGGWVNKSKAKHITPRKRGTPIVYVGYIPTPLFMPTVGGSNLCRGSLSSVFLLLLYAVPTCFFLFLLFLFTLFSFTFSLVTLQSPLACRDFYPLKSA